MLHSEIWNLVFHGAGGFVHSEVYNMPIWLRRFYIKKIQKFHEELNNKETTKSTKRRI